MVHSVVNSGQAQPTCTDDEGCVPLPDRSPLQCKNPPMVYPDLGIAETAPGSSISPDLGTSSCLWWHTRTERRVRVSHPKLLLDLLGHPIEACSDLLLVSAREPDTRAFWNLRLYSD